MKLALLIFLFGIVGCQQKPTFGVTESGVLVQDQDYRKIISADAVVFDTRSPFEFNTNKVPGSINLPLTDFEASRDPLDAARRLSLYGVNPATAVVIIGDGQGDEQKLAWEFIKLGVTHIETLKSSVFRMMNLKPEGPKKNVPLWKPEVGYGELDKKGFEKKIESLRPKLTTHAKATVFQGFPVNRALRERVLVVTTENKWAKADEYSYADHFYFNDQNLFDEKGLLNRAQLKGQNAGFDPGKYDVVFLLDSSSRKEAHAYALVEFGAQSLFLVH